MNTIVDETDLVTAAYDGPFEQPMWQTFLDRLRQRTRADCASITFRPPSSPETHQIRLVSGRMAETPRSATAQAQLDRFRAEFYTGLREDRVYALDDLLQPEDPGHALMLRDGLGALRIDSLRVIRIVEPGGLNAWIEVERAGADFSASDGALISRLAPHFRRSLRAYAEIERQRSSARMAADVMARLNFGWIRLSAKGMVVEQSPEAAKLLQHGAGLRLTRSGQLIADDPPTDRRLSAALRAVVESPDPHPRALNVSQDPWVDLLLVPASSDPGTPDHGKEAVVYIQGDNRSLSDRHEQIAELFGLLPSEARFALALSRGLSIAEAAEKMGITIETARNYSKKVYAKMGARGQVDVVRFILAGVLALA